MKRRFVLALVLLVGLYLVISWRLGMSFRGPGIVRMLAFGWAEFLTTNLKGASWNWGMLITGCVLSAAVVILMAMLVARFTTKGAGRIRPWRLALAAYVALWLLFAIGFGASGLYRHVTWYLTTKVPLYQEVLNVTAEFRIAEGELEQILLENRHDIGKCRTAVSSESRYSREGMPMVERFDVILYPDTSGKVAAYLLVPRSPLLLKRGYFHDGESMRPMTELHATISSLEAKYPSAK